MKSPTNLRRTNPRCCLGCIYRIGMDVERLGGRMEITMVCARDTSMSIEDEPEFTICDGFKNPPKANP